MMMGWPFKSWPIPTAIALLFSAVAITFSVGLYVKGRDEATARADQVCRIFEQAHKDDVDQLIQTYAYLDKLTPQEVHDPLNTFVILNLPTQEKRARTDSAPEFCDEPGVGLPEPDPVLPKMRDFSGLLKP